MRVAQQDLKLPRVIGVDACQVCVSPVQAYCVQGWAALCCAALCCAVLCCAVLCCAVLCCAVLMLRVCPLTPKSSCQPVHDLQIREKDWCNVITAHHGDCAAYTWRLQNFTLGEHVLKPPKSKKRKADRGPDAQEPLPAPVTAVGMSQCGNYGLVGRASGTVDRYNMQSGLHRGSYTRYMTVGPACFLTAKTGLLGVVKSNNALFRKQRCAT